MCAAYKRYPADAFAPQQSAEDEERYVRQKFTPIMEDEAEGPPPLDFDALEEEEAPLPAKDKEEEQDEEYMTGFVRYIVFMTVFDTPVQALSPPRAGDGDALNRDKRAAAAASAQAVLFRTHEWQPCVDKLARAIAGTQLPPEAVHFHRTVQRVPQLQRVSDCELVANGERLVVSRPAFADLLVAVHTVYHFDKHVRYAVVDALRSQPEGATYVDTWRTLHGTQSARAVSQWQPDSSQFVRDICRLRDTLRAAQSWTV